MPRRYKAKIYRVQDMAELNCGEVTKAHAFAMAEEKFRIGALPFARPDRKVVIRIEELPTEKAQGDLLGDAPERAEGELLEGGQDAEIS